jgi:signal transduction histidine kinase
MKRKVKKVTTTKRVVAMPDAISLSEHRRMAAELSEDEERVALAALDSLIAQIGMLDDEGTIVAVNKTWRDFSLLAADTDRARPGENYFAHCAALPVGSGHFGELAQGVQAVLRGDRETFDLEYPCPTSAGEKWFHARVTTCTARGPVRAVIAHEDISERVELERDIVSVSEHEQQRFRQELHDGLSQQLTGLKFKASLLEYHLQSRQLPEANDAKALSELLNQATDEASQLARRMRPVEVESRGLMMALRELAANIEHVYHITCTATISRPVFIHDNNVATNLFRIAEQAVDFAAAQGEAQKVQITLSESKDRVTLSVRDNGKPLPERPRDGLSAHMMRYHARIIGGLLEWRTETPNGATMLCCFRKRPSAR